jgi:hypothetical protein
MYVVQFEFICRARCTYLTLCQHLYEGKENEVVAMENGGNAKVNAIFEARLSKPKPDVHANMTVRNTYIREKYERRMFYDPQAFVEFDSAPREAPPAPTAHQTAAMAAAASEAARLRVAERQARSGGGVRRLKSSDQLANSSSDHHQAVAQPASRRPKSSGPKRTNSSDNLTIPRAPESGPAHFGPMTGDLLDFDAAPSSSATPPAGKPVSAESLTDFFGNVTINGTATNGTANKPAASFPFDSFTTTAALGPAAATAPSKSSFPDVFADFKVAEANSAGNASASIAKNSGDIMSLYNNNPNMAPHSFLNHPQNPLMNNNPMMAMNNTVNFGGMSMPEQQQMMMMQQQFQMQQAMLQQGQFMMNPQRMQQQQQGFPAMAANNNFFQATAPSSTAGQASQFNQKMPQAGPQRQQPEKEDAFAEFSVNAFRR